MLNKIPVVFAAYPAVLAGAEAIARGRTGPKLITLYRAMCDAAGVKHAAVSDDLFLTAFNVRR